jgi:penicillin-binding protein 2
VSIIEAITQSCDVFYYQAGDKVGVDALAKYAMASGLGKKTGIMLEGEKKGLIPTSSWKKQRFNEPWHRGETLSIAIGQGYDLVTPLQMAVFIAAVGNGGTLYKPRIVSTIEGSQGNVIKEIPPEVAGKLPVGKKTLEILQKGLSDVVETDRGTAKRIRLKHVKIAGKTGTAQVFSVKSGDNLKTEHLDFYLRDHAWFICYAPAENPVIAVSVLIEHGAHGSTAAAPIAAALIRQYIHDPSAELIETNVSEEESETE